MEEAELCTGLAAVVPVDWRKLRKSLNLVEAMPFFWHRVKI